MERDEGYSICEILLAFNDLTRDCGSAIYFMYIAFEASIMSSSTVFTNNRSQAVRLPADARFPDSVKRVEVRVRGHERVIAPANCTWDSFFVEPQLPSDDFMTERASQTQADRESL
jgi:antitoxin VapB